MKKFCLNIGIAKINSAFFQEDAFIAKINSKNTSFFMSQSEKYYAEWNHHFCAAHKVIFLQVNKYIFQLTKYEPKDIRESIDSDDTNLSFIGFAE